MSLNDVNSYKLKKIQYLCARLNDIDNFVGLAFINNRGREPH
ncbi:hypothetical protein SAMN04489797_1209 [Winogradskyella sediminis]|uniref:Uncharacterized protein n=1 Tax=Winogradskyella sediminis TaxID=1382466 RepID=A0A1H1QR53_9FLAO|nr:hypothetical protein C8N41_101966 [Winogradskyella sediminis]SDS25950.1 hypothetical protein SAMN04489797_1209 [Winogradskyella sediminis]